MTIDGLRDRKRELLAKKKYELELQAGGNGDPMALFLVNEELLEINAQLKALTPGKRMGCTQQVPTGEKDWALDRRQFLEWRREDTALDGEIDKGRLRLRKAAVQGLEQLTPKQRRVLELHLQGISGAETARRLGVNKSTVSRLLRRAKDKVQIHTERTMMAAKIRDENARVDLTDPAGAKAVLSALTPKQAVYFYLYFAEYLSVREIEALTGTHYSTVYRTVHRALRNIGKMLGGAETVLERPEALDELVYPIYCELEDHPEMLPVKMPKLKKYRPPGKTAPQERTLERRPLPLPSLSGPLAVRVSVSPQAPRTPGKLLSALLKRAAQHTAEPGDSYPVFRWLEAAFVALQARFAMKKRNRKG